jgi:hypothetical protein
MLFEGSGLKNDFINIWDQYHFVPIDKRVREGVSISARPVGVVVYGAHRFFFLGSVSVPVSCQLSVLSSQLLVVSFGDRYPIYLTCTAWAG